MSRSVIVVPVEQVTDIVRIVRVATTIAVAPADVHLVRVETDSGRSVSQWPGQSAWPPENEARMAARVAAVARAVAGEGVAIRTVSVRGKAEAILPAYARLVGARAIIVERDYGTSRIWRNAAVVRRLSRSSPVPVLVSPAQGPALDRVARGEIGRVIVAVDSSVASEVAMRTGVALAGRHEARLTMVHARNNVPERMVFSASEASRVMQRLVAEERQLAGQLRRRAARLGNTNAQAQVVTGSAGPAIVSAATSSDADLVVMGVAPRTALDRLFLGSTLGTVLRRARTPVLVVPVTGGTEQWDERTVREDAFAALAEPGLTARSAA